VQEIPLLLGAIGYTFVFGGRRGEEEEEEEEDKDEKCKEQMKKQNTGFGFKSYPNKKKGTLSCSQLQKNSHEKN
jgi:hypothetical protein